MKVYLFDIAKSVSIALRKQKEKNSPVFRNQDMFSLSSFPSLSTSLKK